LNKIREEEFHRRGERSSKDAFLIGMPGY